MLKQSFGSVEVTWLDQAAVLQAVKKAVRRLAARRPEIERVVIFGSMARGDAVPGSDVDLMIVLSWSDLSFLDRSRLYWPEGVPIGVDVFAYTQEEVQRMQSEGNAFICDALAEGQVIFKRAERAGEKTSSAARAGPP